MKLAYFLPQVTTDTGATWQSRRVGGFRLLDN